MEFQLFEEFRGRFCPDCEEPMYQEFEGAVFPRACKCRREHQKQFESYQQQEAKRKEQEFYSKKFQQANLGRRFQDRTFESYIPNGNVRSFNICRRYADIFEDLKTKGKGLVLYGKVGTGKTHLAASILHEVLKKNFSCVFGTLISLLSKLRNTYNDKTQSEEEILQNLCAVDLLIIDDLGKEKKSEWQLEKLYHIVNARYENMLPTIITTNLSMSEFEKNVGEACFSRLSESCEFVCFAGKDYRLKKEKQT